MRPTIFVIGSLLIACSPSQSAELAPLTREMRVDRFGDPLPEGAVARLGTARLRHSRAGNLTFSSDGSRFVTWDMNGIVYTWETATGRQLGSWAREGYFHNYASICVDGNLVAVNTGQAIEIWNSVEQVCVRKLFQPGACGIKGAQFSARGKFIAIAQQTLEQDVHLRVWDLETGKSVLVGSVDRSFRHSLLDDQGQRLYALTDEKDGLSAWDVRGQKEIWRTNNLGAHSFALRADGKRLALTCGYSLEQSLVQQVDSETGKRIERGSFPIDSASPFCLSADGKQAALVRKDQSIIIDADSGKEILKLQIDIDAKPANSLSIVQSLAFCPDGKSLHLAGADGIIRAYDRSTGKSLYASVENSGHDDVVHRIVWSPDARHVATVAGYYDARFIIWKAASGEVCHMFRKDACSGHDFTRDGKQLIGVGRLLSYHQWCVADGKETASWKPGNPELRRRFENWDVKVKFLPSRQQIRHVATGPQPQPESIWVALYDLRTEKWSNVHEIKPGVVQGLPFLFSAYSCALGSNQVVCGESVFDLATGFPCPKLQNADAKNLFTKPFLSDDDRLVAASEKKAPFSPDAVHLLTVFERVTGRSFRELSQAPTGPCVFSPDGRLLAAGQRDGLHIRDVALGKEVLFRKTPHRVDPTHTRDSFASSMSFSPDGRYIATCHPDTTILIWDVALPVSQKVTGLSPDELESVWANLAHPDPAKGMAAVWALQDRPEQALLLLKDRLKPSETPVAAQMKKLIDDLDADSFRQRDAAMKTLNDLGDAVKTDLEKALTGHPSPEQEKRLKELLAMLDSRQPPHGNDLRAIRCLAVLERLKNNESMNLIAQVAKGVESARLTQEAKQTVERLSAKGDTE